MEKLSRLSSKESSGNQPLDGRYRIVVDLQVTASKKFTLPELEKLVASAGFVEEMFVEKYISKREITASAPFNVGDTVELSEDIQCVKPVYLDKLGNLVISDFPMSSQVEKVGEFAINLPQGTTAEINKKAVNGQAEILFNGQSVEVSDLEREAYLGIIELPCDLFIKADI